MLASLGEMWNRLKKKFQSKGSIDVTHLPLTLQYRDEKTGWRDKTHGSATIQMIILTKGARQQLLNVGTYCRLDAVGFTDTAVDVADEIQVGTVYYQVDGVRAIQRTPGTIEYYKCDLTELTLHD